MTGTTEPRRFRFCRLPLRPAAFTVLTALAAACGGGDLLLPGDGAPASISIVKGNDQVDTVGHSLDDSLVVKVTDAKSRAVEGVAVVFLAPAGAGVTPNDTILTGSNGQAAVHYTLSTTAGEQRVEARAVPIVPATSASAMFTASALPENAQELVAAGGDQQMAEVATALPESLAVLAVDRFGNGVPGIEVTWDARGSGEPSPKSATTGPDGRAATQLTLGDRPGSYSVSAAAEDLQGSPVSFSVRAVAAPQPALTLVTQPSSSATAGVPLSQQPELQLEDPFGAPLARDKVSVTVQIASGGGSLGGKTTVKSDASGRVRFADLELRGETGSHTLIFAADGFTPVTSGSITLNPGPPAKDRSSVQVPGGTAGVATIIALHLEDEFGNPVTGMGDAMAISVQGANPATGLGVTELGDGSYSSSYVPVHSGADAVIVEINGAPLAGSPFQTIVAPGPSDAAHTTAEVRRTGGLFTQIVALVMVRDAQDNLVGRGGDQVAVAVNDVPQGNAADNGDGTYTFSNVYFGIDFRVAITLNGVPIQGSPFTPEVQ